MTSDRPPLSETHPTLCAEIGQAGHRPPVSWWLIKPLQETTVDIAEHERIVAESKNESYTKGLEQGENNFKAVHERIVAKEKSKTLATANQLHKIIKYEKTVQLEEEIERLKKELEEAKQSEEHWKKSFEDSPMLLEGERRAMQRTKEVLLLLCERYEDRHAPDSLNDLRLAMFKLGLSEEEKK